MLYGLRPATSSRSVVQAFASATLAYSIPPVTSPRRLFVLFTLLCAAVLVTAGISAVATDTSSAAKKRCRTVVKKTRGKSKRVRVCTMVTSSGSKKKPSKPKPKPPTGADLTITATVSADEVEAGQSLVFRVTVRNRGPRPAKNVVLSLESPIGVDAVRADDAGACESPGTGPTAFRCRLAALAVRSDWTVELEGKPSDVGVIRFAAAVRATTADPAPKNGAAEDEVEVTPRLEPPPPPLDP